MSFADREKFDSTHHGSITHDLLASAAAYEVTKAWENHLATNGKPDSHAQAKEAIAALLAGAFTHLAESKGLDAWDSHKKSQAEAKAREQLEDRLLAEGY